MAVSVGNYAPNLVTDLLRVTFKIHKHVRALSVHRAHPTPHSHDTQQCQHNCGARARGLLCVTELFDAAELDFAALAAQRDVSVMRPQGKRIGAQLPDQPAQWARD